MFKRAIAGIILPILTTAMAAQPLPPTAGTPSPRPVEETVLPHKAPQPGPRPEPGEAPPSAKPPPAMGTALPASEIACRRALTARGVRFTEKPAISEPEGCSIPHPIEIGTLSAEIAVDPPAILNCATARATADFVARTVDPAARLTFGAGVKAIANASAYVCRPRAGTARLSEHAYGNAIDIASILLQDGTRIDVSTAYQDGQKTGPFLDRIRKAACGPFKTVLGPGADADHAGHLHLDLAARRRGGTFCQ